MEDGEDWPNGKLVPDAPPQAYLIQEICQEFFKHYEDRETNHGESWSLRRIAEDCDLTPRTVFDLKKGRTWGTLPVIASIEARFGERLWGVRHIQRARGES